MPKIPIKQIDFGGEKYAVESVDNLKTDGGRVLSGEVTHGQHTIELDKTLCMKRQTAVLMHECYHYYLTTYGYTQHIPPEMLEGLIDTLAISTITLIKRNPNLIELIQEQT